MGLPVCFLAMSQELESRTSSRLQFEIADSESPGPGAVCTVGTTSHNAAARNQRQRSLEPDSLCQMASPAGAAAASAVE